MTRSNTARRTSTAFIIFGAVIAMLVGMLIGRYDRWPMTTLVSTALAMKKSITIWFVGDKQFVANRLADNYTVANTQKNTSTRAIDTSILPLLLTAFPLSGSGSFAANDELVRGALTRVGNSLLVMDKLGNIFEFKSGALHRMDYGNFPNGIQAAILSTAQSSGRPLSITAVRTLYIAYDKGSSRLFVSHQRYSPISKHVRFTISSIAIDRETLSRAGSWRTVFETEDIPNDLSFRGATGGRLLVVGNYLYFSIGDYNFGQVPLEKSELAAQSSESPFGKVFQYDLTNGSTIVKSVGHRNPQGLAVDNEGQLISTEHGPEGGDELNIIVAGRNYGWPYKTHGTDYGTFGWPIQFRPPDIAFTEPFFAWVPSIAVSPIIRVNAFDDRWNGDLLVGSLKAQTLFRLRTTQNRVVYSEPIWIGHRIRDIVEMPDGITLLTDDPALVFVRVDKARLAANTKMQKNVEMTPALAKCLNCHHFGDTNSTHLAPTLASIIGRKIASDGFERYSESLSRKGGTWDIKSLEAFIRNPNKFAPGTSMPNQNLSDTQVNEIIMTLGATRTK